MSSRYVSCALCGERFRDLAEFQRHQAMNVCVRRPRKPPEPRPQRHVGDRLTTEQRRKLRALAKRDH